MSTRETPKNDEVTRFLEGLDHPMKKEIEQLRQDILSAHAGLSENIKWNGPNYCFGDADRITMRIHPPRQIQLIFHRGARVLEQPKEKLIEDNSGLLVWKTNDRAIATYRSMEEITSKKATLTKVIHAWLEATQEQTDPGKPTVD
jgi:hypothetical protein